MSRASTDPRPLVLHLVYRFDTGGLENGVVNLINHMPADACRHVVVALTEVVPAFAQRIRRPDVRFISLHKPPGHAVKLYPRLYRLFRDLRPDVVHTRNLAALECQVPAALAGVPVRIHGEHGRDTSDPHGTVRRYQWIRRLYAPFVHRYIALSRDLGDYLRQRVGIDGARIAQIYNGVDTDRFAPPADPACARLPITGCPFGAAGEVLIGTVGRLSPEKDQLLLARGFVRLLQRQPALRAQARLVIVGRGVLQAPIEQVLREGGVSELAWLAGERHDVPDVMRGLDVFVLPSLAEGISNTILEAMTSARPVVATAVGGNGDLVDDPHTGRLVPAAEPEAMADALAPLVTDAARRRTLGAAGRQRVLDRFSLDAMVGAYQRQYEQLLALRAPDRAARP
ncbi:TIGR03088 family PEP-CTERM/XrtA system glycosyltransferase [Pseudaquabacterium rugosum]|uniref:TIGR03088 family PEP-CTERM/XrtA system glycosyltransferase n=1 Tax=Pseudaquabacterium rugosum TaxID=2984194 RepID=A0ABU9B5N0_9BURK